MSFLSRNSSTRQERNPTLGTELALDIGQLRIAPRRVGGQIGLSPKQTMSNRKSAADIVSLPDRGTPTPPQWSFEGGAGDESNSLVSFKPESEPAKPAARRVPLRTIALALTAVSLTVPVSWLGWQTWRARAASVRSTPAVAPTGTAVINSVPDGASIAIDGVARGTTPIRISLSPGAHSVQITSGSVTRTLPITVEAGSVVSQYVELAVAAQPLGGRLEIGSDPPGAEVRVDGVSRGLTPLVINDITPGQHRITLSAGENVVNRTVNVTRGATSTIVVSTAPADAGASGGWLTIDAPIEMEILEGGRVLGSTRTDRLMLPVGSHRIEVHQRGARVYELSHCANHRGQDGERCDLPAGRTPLGQRCAVGRCVHRWIVCRYDTSW